MFKANLSIKAMDEKQKEPNLSLSYQLIYNSILKNRDPIKESVLYNSSLMGSYKLIIIF